MPQSNNQRASGPRGFETLRIIPAFRRNAVAALQTLHAEPLLKLHRTNTGELPAYLQRYGIDLVE